MAEAGYQVTAVDPHQPSIERGRALAPSVKFIHGLVGELSLNQFDCVIISEVLEHLDSPEALLRASLPYLAEPGLLIVTVPNGYGEFELDRRLYAALQLERVAALSFWEGQFRSAPSQGQMTRVRTYSDSRFRGCAKCSNAMV